MMHQFSFKNYKSFKDQATLNLSATSSKELRNNVVRDIMRTRILKVAAIYGANASGKSNVLSAFDNMRYIVLNSLQTTGERKRRLPEPNWFEDPSVPTDFNVTFSTDTELYQYRFSILHGTIQTEALYRKNSSEDFSLLFLREKGEFSGELFTENGFEKITEGVSPETLLLSLLAKLNLPVAQEVVTWFDAVKIADYGNFSTDRGKYYHIDHYQEFLKPLVALLKDRTERNLLKRFLQAIDLGVVGIDVIDATSADEYYATSPMQGTRIVTYHKNPRTGRLLLTPLESESSGTLKIIMMYVDIRNIMAMGGTLLIDELDAKLHPLLIKHIISMFHNQRFNPNHAQLIFTTQELFTLDKDYMRRDEIWFVDKNPYNESELYSLASLSHSKNHSHNDASYARDYLAGRYKSIPGIDELT